MKKGIKKLWIAALRSGKYEQGRTALRSDEGFCCLGVLCDIYGQQFGKRWTGRKGRDQSFDGATYFLPTSVVEWSGMKTGDPTVKGERLAVMNDRGDSFNSIADRIEKYL